MKKPELLAPAGSKESLIAAIEAGCDAVYLSGKKYGARAFANNFNDDELIEAIKYSHLYGVKVYVTVNTIIYENEIEDFIKYIEFLHKNNVDAIIMQDLGMIDLIKKTYPNLEIHISTQAHVHNIEGVKFFENQGLKRIVLARETSIDQIKQIKKECKAEIEIFAHGALCISYSGQCLMSSLIGGRSGNRGACAGCCRLPYDLITDKQINKDKYLLSTKDLMTLEKIGELIEIGVDSLKIEGRMKRPEYVYLIVSMYRKAIDSYIKEGKTNITENDIKEMKKLFNREFTKGYLFNEKYIVNQKRPNHMGIEIGTVINYNKGIAKIKLTDTLNINDGIRIVGKKDVGQIVTQMKKNNQNIKSAKKEDIIEIKCDEVTKNSKVLKTTDYEQLNEINNIIKSKQRKVEINIKIELKENKPIYIEITDEKNKVSETLGQITKANNQPTTKEIIKKQLNRLGDTIFKIKNIEIIMDENIFVPVSQLNEIRRKAVEKLIEKRLYKIEVKKEKYTIELPDFKQTKQKSILDGTGNYDYIYTSDYNKIKENIYYKVPRVNYEYKEINKHVLIGEVGSIYKYKDFDTDFSFNVVNSYAVAFLHNQGAKKITLSYELDTKQIKDIIDAYHKRYNKHPNLEVITQAQEEVMISKFNLLEYYGIKEGKLRDKFKNLYPIKIKDGLMYIYNYKKRELNEEELYNIGVNVVRINLV